MVTRNPFSSWDLSFRTSATAWLALNGSTREEEQMKLVEEACKAAYAHDFVRALPEVSILLPNFDTTSKTGVGISNTSGREGQPIVWWTETARCHRSQHHF